MSQAAARRRSLLRADKAAWLTLAIMLIIPWLPFLKLSILNNLILAAQYAVVAVALVLLTGWVGQISLGHAGLVGVGAYITGSMIGRFNMTFPVVMLWGAVGGAVIAAVLGTVALRVRGLYLAVATLIFSWMADEFLFRQRWLTEHSTVTIKALGREGFFPYFDWDSPNKRVYYYAAWAMVAAAVYFCANLRDSKTGRAFFAVRGSEMAAASLGINVIRTKLTAFAVSGAIAGAAGGLIMVGRQTVQADQFGISFSLFYLSIAVVGGLASLGGAVAASLIFAALNELFFRVTQLSGYLEVVSAALLVLTLLLYRGGLAALWQMVYQRLSPAGRKAATVTASFFGAFDKGRRAANAGIAAKLSRPKAPKPKRPAAKLLPSLPGLPAPLLKVVKALIPKTKIVPESPLDLEELLVASQSPEVFPNGRGSTLDWDGLGQGSIQDLQLASLNLPTPQLSPYRQQRRPLLEARNITVQFGGLTAVKDASLEVREGEIVGLIGPNGAGKTTLFNATAGLNQPTKGRVFLYGNDVTDLGVHERAQVGVGRTFQAIQLFGQLSIFDNLLVATHMRNPSGFLSHVFVGPRALRAERKARRQVNRVLQLLNLTDFADRKPADLPFGVLRMVEVARALVTGCKLIMLDEPASGLDNAETDRLIEILRLVRNLGVTLLLIEHDVRMVIAVTDYIYVLEYGSIIAQGEPKDVQNDPKVIAAYLGEPAKAEVTA